MRENVFFDVANLCRCCRLRGAADGSWLCPACRASLGERYARLLDDSMRAALHEEVLTRCSDPLCDDLAEPPRGFAEPPAAGLWRLLARVRDAANAFNRAWWDGPLSWQIVGGTILVLALLTVGSQVAMWQGWVGR